MSILDDAIPAHWPSDAKTLVSDLRRAYRALEKEMDNDQYVLRVDPELSNEIALEAKRFGFCAQQARLWQALRSNSRGVWTKSSLYAALYPAGESRASLKMIDVLFCKMRKRLFVAKAPWAIKTFWGQGYQVVPLKNLADVLMTSQKVDSRCRAELLESIPPGDDLSWQHVKPALLFLGLSQAAMAKKLGVRPRLMHEWCHGASQPPDRYLRIIKGLIEVERHRLAGAAYSHMVSPVSRRIADDIAAARHRAAA